MIHWSCEECLVRAMCTQPCDDVRRHETMKEVCMRYRVRWANIMTKYLAEQSPFLKYMERTGQLKWIES